MRLILLLLRQLFRRRPLLVAEREVRCIELPHNIAIPTHWRKRSRRGTAR
jgi:hypothetical protein